jgi:uncharacterized protein YlxW (UPF0749 family)
MSSLVARARALPSWQITLSVALLALGFLIAAQLAAQGPTVRYTTQERSTLVETALTLQSQQDALKAQILDLRKRIGAAEAQGPGAAASLTQLYADLEQARIGAGLTGLQGTGVVFKLEDAGQPGAGADALVTAHDIRALVQELWLGGAEAVAINGERLTATTAVLDIGGSILVNSAYLSAPYKIAAIGPADLYERLQQSASFRAFFADRIQGAGLGLSVAEPTDVEVQAFAGTVTVRFGQPAASGSPAP